MAENKDIKKTPKRKTNPYSKGLKTNTGHNLTNKEAIFIDKYLELGNQRQAVKEAGYSVRCLSQKAQELLNKTYIKEEIEYRLELARSQRIADVQEIMEYFTGVMRGEVKDQFGLDAPLGERTKAAQELAKRLVDIPNRINGKDEPEIKITLNWDRNNIQE